MPNMFILNSQQLQMIFAQAFYLGYRYALTHGDLKLDQFLWKKVSSADEPPLQQLALTDFTLANIDGRPISMGWMRNAEHRCRDYMPAMPGVAVNVFAAAFNIWQLEQSLLDDKNDLVLIMDEDHKKERVVSSLLGNSPSLSGTKIVYPADILHDPPLFEFFAFSGIANLHPSLRKYFEDNAYDIEADIVSLCGFFFRVFNVFFLFLKKDHEVKEEIADMTKKTVVRGKKKAKIKASIAAAQLLAQQINSSENREEIRRSLIYTYENIFTRPVDAKMKECKFHGIQTCSISVPDTL
jgi:hypothetical protein